MSSDKTGGEAFPQMDSSYVDSHGETKYYTAGGMTLRDYFAAKALGGMISAMSDNAVREMMIENSIEGKRTPKQQMAFSAYEYADEMLQERAK